MTDTYSVTVISAERNVIIPLDLCGKCSSNPQSYALLLLCSLRVRLPEAG